ncbi:DUF6941 family protein [Rhizobium sp. SYY.PMSO]|uniref:DUF6941 family protein n=1 Tax=Rhizobium sp. SYY.PMSO TaxID=3382192 RepID=UPI00398FCAA4
MSIVADAIFCDDIRQEITGKFLFVGVYPGDLVPGVIPSTFPMAMMLRVHGLGKGAHEFDFALTSPSGQRILEQKDIAEVGDPKTPLVLIFSGFPMTVEQPGDIVATINVAGRELIATKLNVAAAKSDLASQ